MKTRILGLCLFLTCFSSLQGIPPAKTLHQKSQYAKAPESKISSLKQRFTRSFITLLQRFQKPIPAVKQRAVSLGVRGLTDEEKIKKIDIEPDLGLLAKLEKRLLLTIQKGAVGLRKFINEKSKDPKRPAKTRATSMGVRGLTDISITRSEELAEPNYQALNNIDNLFPQALTPSNESPPPDHPDSKVTNTESDPDVLEKEFQMGRTIAAKLINAFGLYEDQVLMQYLNLIGLQIAQAAGYPHRFLLVSVLDTPIPNAFAAPGGYIFITKGALKYVQSEDELVAILGHEAGHVFHDHLLANTRAVMSQKQAIQKGTPIYNKRRISRLIPSGKATYIGHISRFIGTNTASLGFKLIIENAYEILLAAGMSKKFELEADQVGLRIAKQMGYQPQKYLNYLNRLSQDNPVSGSVSSTHPPLKTRMALLSQELQKPVTRHPLTAKITNPGEFKPFWQKVLHP